MTHHSIRQYIFPLRSPPSTQTYSIMTSKIVKVAAVQAAPVSFDLGKSLEKVAKLTAEAAESGADLVVFPYVYRRSPRQCFLSNARLQ